MAWNKFKDNLKESFKEAGEKGYQEAVEKREGKKSDKHDLKERVKQMDKEGTAYCPKCYSTDLSANKRGWKLTTGMIGRNKVEVTCLKCGNKFKAGK